MPRVFFFLDLLGREFRQAFMLALSQGHDDDGACADEQNYPIPEPHTLHSSRTTERRAIGSGTTTRATEWRCLTTTPAKEAEAMAKETVTREGEGGVNGNG